MCISNSHRFSEGSCPTLQARRSEKRHVLRYPSSGPFLPATPSLAEQQQQKPLLRGSARSRPQATPQSSALRLCRPPLRYALSTSAALSLQGWGYPSACSCYPRRRGPGPRRCCVNNNSTAIQKQQQRRITDEEASEIHPPCRRQHPNQQQPEHRPRRHRHAAETADRERSNRGQCTTPDRAVGAGTQRRLDRLSHCNGTLPQLLIRQHYGDCAAEAGRDPRCWTVCVEPA